MNKNELLVITHLRQNARETLTRLSRKTGVPVSTIFDQLKRTDVIDKHTCLLNFTKLGFNTRANIMLSVNREDRESIKEYLAKDNNINSVYKTNNGFDFMVEGIFKHIKDMEDFMENLEGRFPIKSKQVFYIIDDIKREGFMADPVLFDLNHHIPIKTLTSP